MSSVLTLYSLIVEPRPECSLRHGRRNQCSFSVLQAVVNFMANVSNAQVPCCAVANQPQNGVAMVFVTWHRHRDGKTVVMLGNLLVALLELCRRLSWPIEIFDMSEIRPTVRWPVGRRLLALSPPVHCMGSNAWQNGNSA